MTYCVGLLQVKASEWRLEEAAERMRMKMRQTDGNWGPFRQGCRDIFTEQRGGTLFRSAERQALIDWIVKSKIREGGAELGPDSSLAHHIQQTFPGGSTVYACCTSPPDTTCFCPVHMYVRKRELMHLWVTFWKDPVVNPIESDRNVILLFPLLTGPCQQPCSN